MELQQQRSEQGILWRLEVSPDSSPAPTKAVLPTETYRAFCFSRLNFVAFPIYRHPLCNFVFTILLHYFQYLSSRIFYCKCTPVYLRLLSRFIDKTVGLLQQLIILLPTPYAVNILCIFWDSHVPGCLVPATKLHKWDISMSWREANLIRTHLRAFFVPIFLNYMLGK